MSRSMINNAQLGPGASPAGASPADRLASIAAFADDAGRLSRAARYSFARQSLAECKTLRLWLLAVGAGKRDTILRALEEHIASRELSEARQAAGARRAKQMGGNQERTR